MKSILGLIVGLLFTSVSFAQESFSLKGVVKNIEGDNLEGATIQFFYVGESDTSNTVTNSKGIFEFKDLRSTKIGIKITFNGYDDFGKLYDYTGQTGEQYLTNIQLSPGSQTLENFVVSTSRITIKEDTVSYKIDSSMYRKNDNVEELLKKLPGLEVDNKTGAVTAQGKEVTKVRVNGKDFFGGDVTTATKNLDADMVDRIDVIDDYGDQAAFTGIRSGEASKTLNIELKKDKNKGVFGSASLGAGTDGRYTNSVTTNIFKNDRQISVIGNLNNTNTSSFNFGNVGGLGSSIARSVGGAFGSFGGSSGIATTKSIGLNYRDKWGAKVSAYGSYSFTDKATTTLRSVQQQNIFNGKSTFNEQNSDNLSESENHRATMNVEVKFNPNTYLKVSPFINFQKTDGNFASDFAFTDQNQQLLNRGTTSEQSKSEAPNIGGSLLFNKRLDKKGRVISITGNAGNTNTNGDDFYLNNTTYFDPLGGMKDSILNQYVNQDNNSYNYSAGASYIEPLTKKKSLEFNYNYSNSFTAVNRKNFLIDKLGERNFIDTASTIYDNDFQTHKLGANFRNTQKKYNYTVGFAVQPTIIESNTINRNISNRQTGINLFPVANFTYNFKKSKSLSFNYNGSTSQPSYTQLQPVADYTNPQFVVVGNPNLKPEFTNRLSARYNNFNFISGTVFFGNLSVNTTSNKIVSNVFSKGVGAQETRYLNTDGYYTVTAFYAYSKPFKNRKYVLNYGGSAIYNNNISFLADEKNVGKNLIFTQRLSTTVTIKKWLETTGGVSYTLNDANYSLNKRLNSNTQAWALTQGSRFFLPKDLTLTYDLSKTLNNGFTGGVGANPFIINASAEKQISKKYNASIKLYAYDILKENVNISRTVTGNAITDSRTNNLTQYFMASLIFRFKKFTGNSTGKEGAPERMIMGGGKPGGF